MSLRNVQFENSVLRVRGNLRRQATGTDDDGKHEEKTLRKQQHASADVDVKHEEKTLRKRQHASADVDNKHEEESFRKHQHVRQQAHGTASIKQLRVAWNGGRIPRVTKRDALQIKVRDLD